LFELPTATLIFRGREGYCIGSFNFGYHNQWASK
jgi:hypothetical protein